MNSFVVAAGDCGDNLAIHNYADQTIFTQACQSNATSIPDAVNGANIYFFGAASPTSSVFEVSWSKFYNALFK